MSRWRIDFDGYWMMHNRAVDVLREHGYGVASHGKADGSFVYLLERDKEIILETQDPEELNNMINLILPPRATKG